MSGQPDNEVFKSIVNSAFAKAVEEAVRHVIAGQIGSGVDSEIKTAIRDEARRLVMEDLEIQQMIRERMVHWIGRQ